MRDHLASGNLNEAVRILQVVLDEMPDRLVGVGAARGKAAAAAPRREPGAPGVPGLAAPSIGSDDRDLFCSVRSEAHHVLMSAPELLERYRQLEEPVAQTRLAAGEVDAVERSYLLTPTGFEAALRVAQHQMEDARFYAALRTLAQLQDHPDRKGDGAAAASRLATQLTRYLDDPAARDLAARWSGHDPASAVAWPSAARIQGHNPLQTGASADLAAVLGKPLRSVRISEDPLIPALLRLLRPESERLPSSARALLFIPTVADDTLYLNNGVEVSAWDRITLAPKWVVRGDVPAGEDPNTIAQSLRNTTRGNLSPEDATMVTVSGRTAVAPLGLAIGMQRWPDPRVVAIDTLTGRVKWSVSVDELDPALASQTVRGPALICEGTVVLSLRASLPDRRMVTLYQAGLDLATGAPRWLHLLGSTGALPYRNDPYVSDAGIVNDGVVYHADMLGVVSATEAGTGRPLWIRRMPPLTGQTWDSLSPWQIGAPVIDGDSIILLSPDHREVVRLDRNTGELRAWCPASRFEQQAARYLVRAGSTLGIVFDNRIALVPIDSFDTAPIRVTPRIAEPGINGRVSATENRLVAPVVGGLMLVDVAKPEAEPVLMPLDSPGNVLALESQLIVVDDTSVHSYLLWEVAEKLLSQRMIDDPADPTSAATLAELAYRAGRQDRIIGAADAAIAALKLRPDAESTEPTRARLFSSLQAMVADSLEPGMEAAPDAPAEAVQGRITDDQLLGELVERLHAAGRTADERLAYLLSLGRLEERRHLPAKAMDTYQRILDDEDLASATWSGPRLSTRGELEVTRRMESLVRDSGAGIYSVHDARAAADAATLPLDAGADAIVRLAVRYPVAAVTASLWERAAEAYRHAGRDHAVVGALESALEAAERIPGGPRVSEVAGRLISELESRQQFAAAGNTLKNVLERHPGTSFTIAGQTVDSRELAARLTQQIAARQRWPRIGDVKGDGVQVLAGWAILEPLMRVRGGVSPHGIVLKSADQVALFTPADPGPGNATGAGDLTPTWRRAIDTEAMELLRLDSEAAYFFFASTKGAVVEKVSQSPAQLKWQTPLFADVPARIPARTGRRDSEMIPTPQDGVALLTDGVITIDDRTLVFLERQGYATAVDTQSGAVLWTIRTPLDRVYDAAVVGGTLVVAGDQEVTAGPGEPVAGLRHEIAVLESRTGQEIQRLPQRWGGVRWVRLTDSGQLIAGCENAIVATDLSRGQVNWVLSDPHLAASRDAWIFQNAIFILDRERRLWWADAQSGRVSPDALDAPRGRLDGVRRIDAFLLAPTADQPTPLVAFSTYQGCLLYDLSGTMKGVDAVGGLDGLLPPIPAHDRLVTITTMPEGRRNERDMIYNIYALDTRSAMVIETAPIVLGVPPRAMAILDGRVVITSGGTTLVLSAPALKEQR